MSESSTTPSSGEAGIPGKKGFGCYNILMTMIAVFAFLVVTFVAIVQMQPEDFSISRSARMKATPQVVFDQVNDFHKWEDWSPWAKIDPSSKVEFAGPNEGVGSKFSWSSDHPQVGAGSMSITKSLTGELIELDLNFTKPFTANNTTLFTFHPEGDETEVTWMMKGKNGFVGKLFSLMMDCDAMVGPDFEKGLASIKGIVEKGASKEMQKDDLPPQNQKEDAATPKDFDAATGPKESGTPKSETKKD